MANEIALPDDNINALNEMLGFAAPVVQERIPRLTVSRVAKDETKYPGLQFPTGVFSIKIDDVPHFALGTVTGRIMYKTFHYMNYNSDTNKMDDVSIMAPDWNVEFRSKSGKIACGRMKAKQFKELSAANLLTKDQIETQKKVSVKMTVFMLVSGEFSSVKSVSMDKQRNTTINYNDPIIVTDKLVALSVSPGDMVTFGDFIEGIVKSKQSPLLTVTELNVRSEVNGTLTYYPITPTVVGSVAAPSPADKEALLETLQFVKSHNDFVEKDYAKSVMAASHTAQASSVVAASSFAGHIIDGEALTLTDDDIAF